ncbi:DDE superfamily endonuclease [Paraburkholderia sp. BL9I2N2]|nr:DDE superfamily endonuclease [Paraburkholderia sp. BL9I2N2]TCK92072.1 DDE superfamily endonuclease [Paraburkholderia sp. BL9I2N2]
MLWMQWWKAISMLRAAFSRLRSFMWFATVVAGLTVRTELLGVTSIVRALKLRPALYNKLCQSLHSDAVQLDRLSALWTQAVLRLFPDPVRVNGRRVLVGDGIKVAKSGKKMPAVKRLHQESDSNTKPEFIMGHSMQQINVLVQADRSVIAVPLATRIHEGLVWSNRDRRTLLDRMIALLGIVSVKDPFYFVADAYYAAGKIVNGLCDKGNHLVTRVKSTAVAYEQYEEQGPRKRGRPKLYGEKIKLKSLLDDPRDVQCAPSPVYGEENVTIQYRVMDLLWRPCARVVRFVVVIHPRRGTCLLMCTDVTLDPIEIIRLYGLRFKIELSFKQAVHRIGAFAYHFWMQDMKPLTRRSGDQYLHRESLEYRNAVKRKIHAYHVFIQAAIICQGLQNYLAVAFPSHVWNSFGSWLRTIRPGIPPSELVVAHALRQSLPEFLVNNAGSHIFAKFIMERQDTETFEMFSAAA